MKVSAMYSPTKKLILNADDYGQSTEINAAVELLLAARRLGGVSVLANGSAWQPAVAYLVQNRCANVGIHWNTVEGTPVSTNPALQVLLNSSGNFVGLPFLFARWLRRPRAVTRALEIEWRAQLERLLAAGIHVTHADSQSTRTCLLSFFLLRPASL